jgi:hypothetical protein
MLTSTPKKWLACEDEAMKLGGHLASIVDNEELRWAATTFLSASVTSLYVGTKRDEKTGVFQSWMDAAPFPSGVSAGSARSAYVLLNCVHTGLCCVMSCVSCCAVSCRVVAL